MKNRVYGMLMAALSLVLADVGYAKSTLISMSMEPEWPATSEPGTVILYKITAVNREGQGMLEVALSCDGLPEGTVVTFTPAVLRFTGRVPRDTNRPHDGEMPDADGNGHHSFHSYRRLAFDSEAFLGYEGLPD